MIGRPRRLVHEQSDAELAIRVSSGDRAAFEALYDRHARQLFSYCRHLLRSREDAEDALQQTFGKAYVALQKGDVPTELRAFLFTVARRECLTIRRRAPAAAEGGVSERPAASPTAEVERREELRAIAADLAGLPPRQSEALVLTELAGLSHAEVAQTVGCDAVQVKALVFQARESLAKGREARAVPCRGVRMELSAARAGRRRAAVARHLLICPGCREFDAEVRRRRRAMATFIGAVTLPQFESMFAPTTAAAASEAAPPSIGLLSGVRERIGLPQNVASPLAHIANASAVGAVLMVASPAFLESEGRVPERPRPDRSDVGISAAFAPQPPARDAVGSEPSQSSPANAPSRRKPRPPAAGSPRRRSPSTRHHRGREPAKPSPSDGASPASTDRSDQPQADTASLRSQPSATSGTRPPARSGEPRKSAPKRQLPGGRRSGRTDRCGEGRDIRRRIELRPPPPLEDRALQRCLEADLPDLPGRQ